MKTPNECIFFSEEKLTTLREEMSLVASLAQSDVTDDFLKNVLCDQIDPNF